MIFSRIDNGWLKVGEEVSSPSCSPMKVMHSGGQEFLCDRVLVAPLSRPIDDRTTNTERCRFHTFQLIYV